MKLLFLSLAEKKCFDLFIWLKLLNILKTSQWHFALWLKQVSFGQTSRGGNIWHGYCFSFKLNKWNVLRFRCFWVCCNSLGCDRGWCVTMGWIYLYVFVFIVCFCCSWWEYAVLIYFVGSMLGSFFFMDVCVEGTAVGMVVSSLISVLFLINAIFEHSLCWMTPDASWLPIR